MADDASNEPLDKEKHTAVANVNDAVKAAPPNAESANSSRPPGEINTSVPTTERTSKRRVSKKTIGTVILTIVTSVVTCIGTVATGWLNWPLDKKFEAELERIKGKIGIDYTAPRLILEGITAEQLKEDRRIRELIVRINEQFVTTVATETTKPFAGQLDSQQLWQILQNCHLPESAVEGTRKFHSTVQAFLQRYSDKDIPRYPSPEAESALSIERSLRTKAIEDLNHWLEEHSKAP